MADLIAQSVINMTINSNDSREILNEQVTNQVLFLKYLIPFRNIKVNQRAM